MIPEKSNSPITLVYIHGFNSDGTGWKADALQKHFPEAKVIAPDFPANPEKVMQQLDVLLKDLEIEKTIIIGTSLGGFYAYLCSARYGLNAWLFNPSLQPFYTLDDRGIGQFYTWTKKRPYLFLEEYLTPMSQLKAEADAKIDVSKLTFFLATDDDVLDHSKLRGQYPTAEIQWFEGAGHSFSKFEKVLKKLKKSQ